MKKKFYKSCCLVFLSYFLKTNMSATCRRLIERSWGNQSLQKNLMLIRQLKNGLTT